MAPGPSGAQPYSDEQRDQLARGGWYRDPFETADERWWDGAKWTQKVRGAPSEDAEAVGARGDAADTDRVRAMGPGWYPYRGETRWWDGERWGPARQAAVAPVRLRTSEEQDVGWRVRAAVGFEQVWLVRLGYVSAVFLPLLGLILGIVVLTRPALRSQRRQGIQIIILSVVITTIAVLLARHK